MFFIHDNSCAFKRQTGSGFPGNGNYGTDPQLNFFTRFESPRPIPTYFTVKQSLQTPIYEPQSAFGSAIFQCLPEVPKKVYFFTSEPGFLY